MTSNGIGEILKNRRLERSLTLKDVAASTHISLRFIQALEEERWEAIPGTVYRQGFLRSYADHLGLDGNQLVRRFFDNSGNSPSAPVASSPLKGVRSEDKTVGTGPWVRVGGLACLLFLVIGFYFYEGQPSVPPSPPLGAMSLRGTVGNAAPTGTFVPRGERILKATVSSPTQNHQFSLRAKKFVWLRAWVDGRVRFEGILSPQSPRSWTGHSTFRVQTEVPHELDAEADNHVLPVSPSGDILWPLPLSNRSSS
jgi:hypothetical protein